MKKAACFIAAAVALLGARVVSADDTDYSKSNWPLKLVERPLTVAGGMLEVRGDTLRIGLSADTAGEPIVLSPDLYYGVSDMFSVGIRHGLLADQGICIDGCDDAYGDVALDVRSAFMHGGVFQVVLHGGVPVSSFSDFGIGVDVGAQARLRTGSIAVLADPTVFFAIHDRDVLPDQLWVPVELQLQLQQQTNVALLSGIEGPLDGLDDAVRVPVGARFLFTVNHRFDLGLAFRFPNLAGEGGTADARELIALGALRL